MVPLTVPSLCPIISGDSIKNLLLLNGIEMKKAASALKFFKVTRGKESRDLHVSWEQS